MRTLSILAALCLASPLAAQSSSTVPAELPRVTVSTLMPPTVRTLRVVAGGNLQAAIDSAKPGDAVELARGATFTGHFTLPNKGSAAAWIVVRPGPGTALPPEGTRMTPALAASLALPKIVTPDYQAAVLTALGSHHYRLVGVEITVALTAPFNYGLVLLGSGEVDQHSMATVAHDLVLDRVYVHGASVTSLSRCVALNSGATAIVDSYLSECHAEGQDAQAIAGWNGPGPYRIANNYLEGSGENIIFGGADPAIPNLVPADIEIRQNHIAKPTSWRGGRWLIKNLIEIKSAQRVLIEGNVLEHNWAHGQEGAGLLLWSVNQGGNAPWTATQDITIRRTIMRNVGAGVVLAATATYPSVPMQRVSITDLLVYGIDAPGFDGNGRGFQIGGGLGSMSDVTIAHSTVLGSTLTALTLLTPPTTRLVMTDNVLDGGTYGIAGDGTGIGAATLTGLAPGGIFANNVLVLGGIYAAYVSSFPPGNRYPNSTTSLGFVNMAGGDFHLAPSSPYAGAGARIDSVLTATAGVIEGTTVPPKTNTLSSLTVSQLQAAIAALDKVIGPTGRESNAIKAALIPVAAELRRLRP